MLIEISNFPSHRFYLCAWAILPINIFRQQTINGHFPRWPPQKFVGSISSEPFDGFHLNPIGGSLDISDDLLNFSVEDILNKWPPKSLWARYWSIHVYGTIHGFAIVTNFIFR